MLVITKARSKSVCKQFLTTTIFGTDKIPFTWTRVVLWACESDSYFSVPLVQSSRLTSWLRGLSQGSKFVLVKVSAKNRDPRPDGVRTWPGFWATGAQGLAAGVAGGAGEVDPRGDHVEAGFLKVLSFSCQNVNFNLLHSDYVDKTFLWRSWFLTEKSLNGFSRRCTIWCWWNWGIRFRCC